MNYQEDGFFNEIQSIQGFISPPQNNSTDYYDEYCRLYLANFVLTSQMKQIIKQKKDLEERLMLFEDKTYQYDQSETLEKNKRNRRNADAINRFHKCTIEGCNKSYGSQGSLNQHIKIKHPQFYNEEQIIESSITPLKVLQENISQNTQRRLKKK